MNKLSVIVRQTTGTLDIISVREKTNIHTEDDVRTTIKKIREPSKVIRILHDNMVSSKLIVCIATILVSIAGFPYTKAQFIFPTDDPLETIINYGRCITPVRERALCINLEQCTFLYNMLQKRPLADADRSYLSRSQCGLNNGKVLICCPSRYIGQQVPPTPPPVQSRGSLPEPGTCGNVISNRIYGGNVTKIDEFPWMALIEYKRGSEPVGHHCGGSLINERYVLTAAHCVKAIPQDWAPFQVRLGEWDTSTERDCERDVRGNEDCADPHVDVPVERAITHDRYIPDSKNQLYDIALLRLARSIAYTDFIRPICLPTKQSLRSANFDGIVMDVSGWGKTEQGISSPVKLKAAVSGVPLADCMRVYSRRSVDLDNSQLCAGGEEGIDSCRGDSGGPLIALDTSNKALVYYFISGIVSFGPTPCGLQGWPGVYTKVSNYIDWIQQNVRA